MANAINVKLFGPWNKVRNLLNDLPRNIKIVSISAQRSVADRYVAKVKAHLKNQDIPGWTPLSDRYADYKMSKFGAEDILIATWDYYDNITSWRSQNVYHAGVKSGITYPGNHGIEIARVAAIHEAWANTPGRPHRPLWAYTLNEDMGGLRGIKVMVNEIFKRRLREKGYPVKSSYLL
jgi:hypothetical protein